MVKCTVCSNRKSVQKHLSFFLYPRDTSRRNSWLKAVGREDLIYKAANTKRVYIRICEEHFEQKYIRYSVRGFIKFLTKNATPTLRLRSGEGTSSSIHSENNAGTESLTQNATNNPSLPGWYSNPANKIQKLIIFDKDTPDITDINAIKDTGAISVCENENQPSTSKTSFDTTSIAKMKLTSQLIPTVMARKFMDNTEPTQIDNFTPQGMAQLIKWEQASSEDNSEKRDSKPFLCFALHLHYLGSTTYKFLRRTFCLPPFNTLRKLVRPRGTKIDDTLFGVLKIKLDKMGPQEKMCSVCVSCVPIDKKLFYDVTHDRIIGFRDIDGTQKYQPANYAVVIMIRGIVLNWKQLVGYAFLSQLQNDADVNAWIYAIISYLLKIGFDVRALVSDHSYVENFFKSVNIDQNYFFIRGQKIYYIFDVPRLISSVKNNFITLNYVFDDNVCRLHYIMDMYNQDKNTLVRLAPKLTDNHFKQSECFELAAQVFSTTVAFAMKTLMQSHVIDSSARATIELILKIDKLFDLLNSSKLQHPNKFKTAFCGDDSQIDYLQKMLGFFRRLKAVEIRSCKDITNSVKFIECFQITIKSFLNLFKDIQLEGIKFIYTRRLNLEPVDNFFTKVNQSHGVSSKPTCRQVIQTYNQMFVSDILKEPIKKTCENDFESLLALQKQSLSLFEVFTQNSKDVTPILLDSNDYQFELPQSNGLLFLSVYLYKKCLEKHECETLNTYINIIKQELAECTQGYTEESHTALPNHFLTYIESLEKTFCDYFNKMCNSSFLQNFCSANIGSEVLTQIQDFKFEAPCECFPFGYLQRLFVRSRIYHSVKKYNAFLKANNYKKLPFEVRIS